MRLYNIRLPHFPPSEGPSALTLEKGSRILLLGASGSGKSSLLKLIAGFSEPASGAIDDGGKRSALLLQNPFHQIIMQTVHDELYFPRKNAGCSSAEAEAAVKETAGTLGIRHLLERDMAMLSFGETQLVMLAATFLTDADIMLLDEPTSHLDRKAVQACYRCMDRAAAGGKTVLVASQNPDEYFYFDTVWIMKAGAVQACMRSEDFAGKHAEYGIIPDSSLIRRRLHELAEKAV